MNIPLSAFVPENLVSRDGFGSPVPRQLAHLYTQAESGACLRYSSRVPRRRPYIYLIRYTPSSQSQVYRVTQLRTDGVHCRESAGTGPVASRTRFNTMKSFCPHSLCSHISRFEIFPPDWVDAQNHRGLDTFKLLFLFLFYTSPWEDAAKKSPL